MTSAISATIKRAEMPTATDPKTGVAILIFDAGQESIASKAIKTNCAMTENRKIPTMEAFAKVSGISRPTLSKYFNDPTSVRPSSRRRIEQALQDFDYTPNIYAINQNRRTTRNIGIVLPNLADPFFTEMGREAELACLEAGYRPILLSAHGAPDQEVANLDTLRTLKPAGVLLSPFGRASDQDAVRRFCDDFPVALLDANIEDAGAAYIGTDCNQSIDLMVSYLCRSGEPPCFLEMKNPLNPNARKRHQAYCDSMARHGFAPQIYQVEGEGWGFEEIGYQEGGRLLRERAFGSNTVLCSNDRLAIGMLAAAYQQDIRVGLSGDMRIAGHDDHPFSRFTGPRLTTIAQEYAAIAQGAAARLFEILEDDQAPVERSETHLPGRLVLRESA